MVFSSYLFLFYFLPLTLALYYAAPRRAQHLILTILSYVFYGWANPLFVVLLLFQTLDRLRRRPGHRRLDPPAWSRPTRKARRRTPSVGRRSDRADRLDLQQPGAARLLQVLQLRRRQLQRAGRLARAPGARSRRRAAGGAAARHQLLHLPVDELRHRRLSRPRRPRSGTSSICCASTSMFPQLVAGPIIRYSEIADQLQSPDVTRRRSSRAASHSSRSAWRRRCCWPTRAARSPTSRSTPGSLGPLEAWYGVTAYAFQIYFDFSGYSDMAIGLGLMLGFVFPKNFDSPYRSQSITEFWHRWHISLSDLAARLPVRAARRQPQGPRPHLREPVRRHAARRPLARRRVELRGLGRAARRAARVRAASRQGGALRRPARAPARRRRRSPSCCSPGCSSARRICRTRSATWATCSALGDPQEGAGLLAGIVYQPYYLGTFLLAGAIVWSAPQTWDWTRTLTLPKAAAVLARACRCRWSVLATQAYNPFIYFIF